MSRHTPGPWNIEGSHVVGGGGLIVRQAAAYDAAQDDLRLIAAAPELLVSAQELLGCMSLAGWEGDPLAEKARAAIAKATGAQA